MLIFLITGKTTKSNTLYSMHPPHHIRDHAGYKEIALQKSGKAKNHASVIQPLRHEHGSTNHFVPCGVG